ncbi:MAG TPA: hypothetical protein VLS89_13140 [Candidatus Nanopelagicales bacterium]|nr:hypothetical protein [Candidatus Nanopelagicales bacterium]
MKLVGLFGLAGSIAIACSATSSSNVFSDGDANGGGVGGAGGAGNTSTGSSEGPGVVSVGVGSGGSTGSGTTCSSQPGDDADMDGFTNPEDCNDCDPNVNPNAVEVTGSDGSGGAGGQPYEPADEDCDGMVDEPTDTCDGALNVADPDPLNGARAVELCKMSTGPSDWGVISAGWVMADGSPATADPDFHLGHGLLSGFGPNVTPRAGVRMLGVSSGAARQPSDPGYQSPGGFSKGYSGNHPQGFPKESPACPGTTTGTPYDPTAIEIQVRVPSNAHGFSFDFNFYTYEWPGYICSTFNDFFVAILNPIPQGQTDGQISFDNAGNPISVNNSLLDVCGCSGGPPCFAGGKTFDCPLGNAELTGTGFEGHAATSWLKTTAPVEPNQIITIRWGAYDSGDGILDSTGLVDNWQWLADPGTVVGTTPVEPEEPE